MSTVQDQIREQIAVLNQRIGIHALRGAPDDLLITAMLDCILLAWVVETDASDEIRARLAAFVSRAALRRLADSLDANRAPVVSPTQRPDASLAFRVVELWDRVGAIGFACRDPESLKEWLSLMHELREWRNAEQPPPPPPPPAVPAG